MDAVTVASSWFTGRATSLLLRGVFLPVIGTEIFQDPQGVVKIHYVNYFHFFRGWSSTQLILVYIPIIYKDFRHFSGGEEFIPS